MTLLFCDSHLGVRKCLVYFRISVFASGHCVVTIVYCLDLTGNNGLRTLLSVLRVWLLAGSMLSALIPFVFYQQLSLWASHLKMLPIRQSWYCLKKVSYVITSCSRKCFRGLFQPRMSANQVWRLIGVNRIGNDSIALFFIRKTKLVDIACEVRIMRSALRTTRHM